LHGSCKNSSPSIKSIPKARTNVDRSSGKKIYSDAYNRPQGVIKGSTSKNNRKSKE